MEKVPLGNTGIMVSRLGIGTGTAHPSGKSAQSLMHRDEFIDLLLYAYSRGIDFWDTAYAYDTHEMISYALKRVDRSKIILSTKLSTIKEKDTIKYFEKSLKELNTDYVDICLLHGVRTQRELKTRAEALETLHKLKEKGYIRVVGLSSHGLSALQGALYNEGIEIVFVRINHAWQCMDSSRLGIYDRMASIAVLKTLFKTLVPPSIRSIVRPHTETNFIDRKDRESIVSILKNIHAKKKGIVGMKILAEGNLRHEVKKAVDYVKSLNFIDSFIVGMLSKKEIEEICSLV